MKREAHSPQTQAAEARDERLHARGSDQPRGEELLASTLEELGVSVEELRTANEACAEYRTAFAASREAHGADRTAYRTLYEYAPDGYLVTDSLGQVLKANRMASELFGMPRAHLINKPIAVFVKLEERQAFRTLLCRIGSGNDAMFTFEGNLVARGGRTFGASIHVASGANQLRWTIRDVTEQRRAHRSLADANEKLGQRTLDLQHEIDERRRLDEVLRRSEERYRMLSAHLHEDIEAERTRLAREVHDELGSALTAIRFELSGLHGAARADGAVQRAIGRVDAAIRATRRICSDLRPSLLDHMGLWAAIEWLVEDMAGRSGLQCKVELEPGSELEEPARTNVFRIVQEAVTNTVRHAKAGSLRVSARGKAGELEIEIADDGRGICASELARPDAFGITGMQERARACGGRIVIEPAARGTRVLLRVPFAAAGIPCAS